MQDGGAEPNGELIMAKLDKTGSNSSTSGALLAKDGDKIIELHYKWGKGYIQVNELCLMIFVL